MEDIHKFIISPSVKVIEAMSTINRMGEGIVFVCENESLLGTLSDGDIRRHILRGGDLSAPVSEVANYNFKYLTIDNTASAQEMLKRYKLRSLPVLDENGRLVSICFANSVVIRAVSRINFPVVIMAGGKGTRLHPYTKVLPKPLIPIGDIPITMHIMQHFEEYGCKNFTLIINHHKELIKAYFSDLNMPYIVNYEEEIEPLGTGGGIKLLEGKISETFFLTNCDILIEADYADIVHYHREKKNIVTMVCAVKKMTIPYGTVTLDSDGLIDSMIEKPTFSFLTNTGFYVIEPHIFNYIPTNTFIHITEIIQNCMDHGERVGAYPISENQWSDMGRLDEMEKMKERLKGKRQSINTNWQRG